MTECSEHFFGGRWLVFRYCFYIKGSTHYNKVEYRNS